MVEVVLGARIGASMTRLAGKYELLRHSATEAWQAVVFGENNFSHHGGGRSRAGR